MLSMPTCYLHQKSELLTNLKFPLENKNHPLDLRILQREFLAPLKIQLLEMPHITTSYIWIKFLAQALTLLK